MRINSKLPKTFVIFATKNSKQGYLRLYSFLDTEGEVQFNYKLEPDIKNSSKFVNFDNVKDEALHYMNIYKLTDVKVIDESTSKVYKISK